MICYVFAMGKQHLGPHAVAGYGIKTFWRGVFITSPDHLERALAFPWRSAVSTHMRMCRNSTCLWIVA